MRENSSSSGSRTPTNSSSSVPVQMRSWAAWWILLVFCLVTSRLERQLWQSNGERVQRQADYEVAHILWYASSTNNNDSEHDVVMVGVPSDPYFLKRQEVTSLLFWDRLARSHRKETQSYYYANVSVTPETVCHDLPGHGWEGGDGAYRLLTEKIQIDQQQLHHDKIATVSSITQVRLLCGVYTHSRLHNLATVAAHTWGRQCDGFLAFTNDTATATEPWKVSLNHTGPESYHNMWQKTRSILKYMYDHHRDDFDWYHLSGDDTFVIVPNLKAFLAQQQQQQQHSNSTTPPRPQLAGQWIRQRHFPYCAGGPGYTFNRAALEVFATQLYSTFHVDTVASHEDRLLSQALLSIPYTDLIDTRDQDGEQRYHGTGPQQIYDGRAAPNEPQPNGRRRRRPNFHSRNLAYWETLPHPTLHNQKNYDGSSIPMWKPVVNGTTTDNGTAMVPVVGPKYGFEAASASSVAFHQIHHPVYMARIYAILYNGTICPSDSVLEKARGYQQQQR